MATSVGFQLEGGRIPGERIATSVDTNDSATFTTTETQVMSVTAPLVSGRTYKLVQFSRWRSTQAGDTIAVRIRDDDVNGSFRGSNLVHVVDTDSFGWPSYTESEYTATSTGDHTFVLTGERDAGGGDCNMEGNSDSRESYLYVDYIRG